MWNYTKTLFIQYLRTPYTYIAFSLSMIFIIGLGRIIPAGMIIPAAITVGITVTILFLFGGSVQELRTTSFIKSISLTKLSKSSIVLANMFVASVISLFSVVLILFISWILDASGYLVDNFAAFSSDGTGILVYLNATIIWKQIEWFTFMYAVILTATLSFAISFLIMSFTKTTNGLYVISFIYVFILLLLGAIIIPRVLSMVTDSFVQYLNIWVPHYYSNQLLTAAMVTDNVVLANFIQNSDYGQYIQDISNAIPPIESWNWDAINADVNTYNSLLAQYQSGELTTAKFVKSLEDTEWNSKIFQYLATDLNQMTKVIDLLKHILGEDVVAQIPGFIFRVSLFQILFLGLPSAWVASIKVLIDSGVIPPDIVNILIAVGSGPYMSPESFGKIVTSISSQSDVLIEYTHSVETWDFTSWESMANSFLPVALSGAFVMIGIRNFKWSIR